MFSQTLFTSLATIFYYNCEKLINITMAHTSHLEGKFWVQQLHSKMVNYIWTIAFPEKSQH